MATEKRERQRTNREQKASQQQRLEQKDKLKQRLALGGIVAIVILGGLFLFSLLSGDEEETDVASDDETTALTLETDALDGDADTDTNSDEGSDSGDNTETDDTGDEASDAAGEDAATVELSPPESGETIDGPTECPAEDGSSERVTSFSEAPPICIDEAKTYNAEVTTTKGTFNLELDTAAAPNTVNNFVVLARYGFYENVPFHRIIPGFVVQGGDAVGPQLGMGNPGYEIDDELPEEDAYEVGSLAMANSGPNTNGSQFFVITGDQGVALPPDFSLFGNVSEGMGVVTSIEEVGQPENGTPTEEVLIESVTITES